MGGKGALGSPDDFSFLRALLIFSVLFWFSFFFFFSSAAETDDGVGGINV